MVCECNAILELEHLLSNWPLRNVHVYSELWVTKSASELIANRKDASWEVAAELLLFD